MVSRRRAPLKPAVFSIVLISVFTYFHPFTAEAQTAWGLPAPWSAQDVGNPAIAGSSSFDQGQFTVNASGTDIWDSSDQFHFVYQQVTGDVDVVARVDSLANTDPWAKAG